MTLNSKSLVNLVGAAKAATFSFLHDAKRPAFLANWETERASIEANLQEAHSAYTSQTSSPVAAISLELASFLYFVCLQTRPRVVLDLGSGFSSYVLRRYQAAGEVDVHSVDDDSLWLDRTRAFLSSQKLSTDNLHLWDDLLASALQIKADLILHDMGNSHKRVNTLPKLNNFAAPDALIIVDDLHKRNIREATMQWLRVNHFKYVDLAPYTRDTYGRFQWLITTS